MQTQVDVVVVGAGPVGLLTAIELTLGGVRVLVLERLASPSKVTKALGIGALGVEVLQRRGLAPAIAAAEARSFPSRNNTVVQAGQSSQAAEPRYSGHFGGLVLIRADAQKEPERHGHPVDQQTIEAMLTDRALSLGIEIRRQCAVKGFVQHVESIDVEWVSPEGDGSILTSWLIGCDGGRSRIRKMAGFGFPGTPPTLTMYNAVVAIDRPGRLGRGFCHTSGGMYAYGFTPGRLIMMDFNGPPANREAPVTREEVECVLRRVSNIDLRVEAMETGSRWTDNTRLADTYRRGRVLLAGDAAHIHSPFGGQGMSLGLVDAQNLGWKLAAVLRGEMPESFIDTYTTERRPVAEAVLENTRAQAAIMRPDPQSTAMRAIIAKLMQFDDVNRFFGEMMSGLSIRYDLGSELDEVGRLISDRTISDSTISDGDEEDSIYHLMRDGKGVLLDASNGGEASRLAASITQRIRCVPVVMGPSLLIRPDACIAWADHGHGTSGLGEALSRWFLRATG